MTTSAHRSGPFLWQRLLVSTLALAALVAVAWPSAFQGGSFWLYTEWPWQATVAIGNVAAFVGALLGVLLAWRSEDPAAPHLAATLALGALMFGLGSDPVLPETGSLLSAVLDATVPAAAILGLAAFMRFSVLYPAPLTMERIEALGPLGADPDNALRAPEARLPMERAGARVSERVSQWAKDRVPRWAEALGARAAAAWRRLLDRLVRKAPATLQKDMQVDAIRFMHGTATHAGRYGVVAVVALAIILLLGPGEVMDFVFILAFGPLAWSWALLRISYVTGDTADRRKILWILQGFILFIGIQALVVYSFMIPVLFSSAARLLMIKLWPPAMALGALALVICLAIAVFWAGALDPGRALRSTVVYGGLGLVLTVVFGLMENVASEYVMGWVGLPGNYAVWLSTGVTAVVFSALHRRFERTASGLFRDGELDGAEADISVDPVAADRRIP